MKWSLFLFCIAGFYQIVFAQWIEPQKANLNAVDSILWPMPVILETDVPENGVIIPGSCMSSPVYFDSTTSILYRVIFYASRKNFYIPSISCGGAEYCIDGNRTDVTSSFDYKLPTPTIINNAFYSHGRIFDQFWYW